MDETHVGEGVDAVVEPVGQEADRSGRIRGERAVERALERAAVREVRSAKREDYSARALEEQKLLDRLRAERNAAEDERRAQAWQMAVDRELASAQRRSEWVDAHARTAEARRAAKAAERAELERVRPIEAARLKELRDERIAYEDRRAADILARGAQDAMEMSERHSAWTDSIQVVSDAKKAYKRLREEGKQARREERVRLREIREQERAQRNALADERAAKVRAAAQAAAIATAELWEAEESGDARRINRATAELKRLRDEEQQLRKSFRELRNAEEEQRIARDWQQAKDRELADAAEREELIEARHRMVVERRKAMRADRDYRAAHRDERAREEADERTRRNALAQARQDEVVRMNLSREFELCGLRQEWLDAKEREREIWSRIKDEDAAARKSDLILEAEAAERFRSERNAQEEAHRTQIWDTYKQREYDQSVDREIARANAREAYVSMRSEAPSEE